MRGLQAEGGELSWQVQPAAELKSGEVRVRVMAAGLNRADLLQKAGMYPPPPGVTEAAAIPEVFSTAWLNVFVLGNARPGEKVLIHAGASGVGTAAIQLCKAQGNPCWVSVGSQDKLDACVELGAEGGVLRQGGIAALKDFGPFNVALDPVGATYAADHLDLLALDARWVLIGLMGGRDATLDLAKVLAKRISLIGSTLRTRDAEFKATLLADMEQRLMPQFASGELKPMVAKTFGFADATAAFEELARDQVIGKVILVRED